METAIKVLVNAVSLCLVLLTLGQWREQQRFRQHNERRQAYCEGYWTHHAMMAVSLVRRPRGSWISGAFYLFFGFPVLWFCFWLLWEVVFSMLTLLVSIQ